jgi:hypothetical protein
MYDTSGSQSVCHAAYPDYNINARIGWLKGELAVAETRPAARRPLSAVALPLASEELRTPAQAYALLGTLLGLLPPAALFGRFLAASNTWADREVGVLAFCLVMNIICCAVGRLTGGWLGGKLGDPRDRGRVGLLLFAAALGFAWGVITGAAGGVVVFGIGALAGMACAVPVAVAGFTLFAPLHRAVSHGGMIGARHLRPLAFGVAGAIAALILSPEIFQ